MNVLTKDLGLSPVFLDAERKVAVISCDGKILSFAENNDGSSRDISLSAYMEMLDHIIIEPHLNHQPISGRILLYEYMRNQFWCDLYLRYGGVIFKILKGSYQVYQLMPSASSYMQISGRALSSSIVSSSLIGQHKVVQQTQLHASRRTSSSGQVVEAVQHCNGHHKQAAQYRSGKTGVVIGTQMFANRPRPKSSPDRLFGRMSYSRWFHDVFGKLPLASHKCQQLKYLHRNIQSLAFSPLIECYTRKQHCSCTDDKDVFAHVIPHWKMKQLIKRVLTELRISSLIVCGAVNYKKFTCRLLQVFTSNLYTKRKPTFLIQDIKISNCRWLYSLDSHTVADRKQNFLCLVLWLTKTISFVIKYFFYVTESRLYKKRTLFFVRSYWEDRVDHTIQSYIDSNMLQVVSTGRSANTRLRFLAGHNKLRPILSAIKKEFSTSSRFKLKDILGCLKFIRADPASGVAKCTDTLQHLRQFNANITGSRYYFVKADITKCYDSINRKLLLNVVRQRLNEMNIDKFMCWRIAVILSGPGKPTVTYFDHVHRHHRSQGSQPALTLTTACTDYLQRKGLSSAIFVPLHKNTLSATDIVEAIRGHLQNVLIQVETSHGASTKYAMVDGIPQGSVLSSVLCDIYYGLMEKCFLRPDIQHSGNLLLRHVDDYLLLTPSEAVARHFLMTLTSPQVAERFSCVVMMEKTMTNISRDLHQDQFPRSAEGDLQWCQYVFDLTHLSVSFSPSTVQDIHNGISFDGTQKPMAHIRLSLLKHVSAFGNSIFFDSVINDECTVERNIIEVLHRCAVKFCYLQSSLLSQHGLEGVAKDPYRWLEVILDVGRKLYKVIRNHHKRLGDQFVLNLEKIYILCLEEFAHTCGSWKELEVLRKVILSHLTSLEGKWNAY